MGMFNTIVSDITCPKTGQVGRDTEIQIKWQAQGARILDVYHMDDFMPDILPEYDNTWVRTDYICNVCSPKTTGRDGTPYIRTADQIWHMAFVEIRNGKVCRILSEPEFQALGISEFYDDVWPPPEETAGTSPG